MGIEQKILSDKRFSISTDNTFYSISRLCVVTYTFCKTRLGSLLWNSKDGLYSLDRALPYIFLCNMSDSIIYQKYEEYCNSPQNKIGTDSRSPSSLIRLMQTIKVEGYDPKKGAIIVDQFGIVLDGLHRCSVLLYLFGPDYVAQMVRVRRLFLKPKTIFRLIQRRFQDCHGVRNESSI